MTGSRTLQALFYNNPDGYPPVINSTHVLAEAGFQVDILCRQYGQEWGIRYPAGAAVHRVDGRGMASLREYAHFLAAALRRARPEAAIFIGHDMHGLLPARLLATRHRRPLVYHCHDFVDEPAALGLGGRLVKAFEQRCARTAALVIVPDHGRGQVMAAALKLPHAPLVVANAPLRRASEPAEQLTSALQERGCAFSRVVLRQGRIGPGHAIEVTLRSMPDWPDAGWIFAVMGPGDREYIASLRRLADELGVAHRFAVLPPVAYDELAQFTAGAHVGHALYEPIHVNNRYMGTASNKVLEYMAAGLPVLLSSQPGFRQLADKYGCGLAVDEHSAEEVAAAVAALLADPVRAHRLGQAGRQAFVLELNYQVQFAPALEAIRRLAGGSAK